MSCYVSIYLLNYLFIHPAICVHKFIGAKVSGVNSPDSLEPLPVLFSPKTTHVFGHCNNMFSWFFWGSKDPPKNMVWHFFPYFVCKWRMCVSDVIFADVGTCLPFFVFELQTCGISFWRLPKTHLVALTELWQTNVINQKLIRRSFEAKKKEIDV